MFGGGIIAAGINVFFAALAIMMVGMFTAIGLSIYAMVQASRGVLWRYPINVRLVGGS